MDRKTDTIRTCRTVSLRLKTMFCLRVLKLNAKVVACVALSLMMGNGRGWLCGGPGMGMWFVRRERPGVYTGVLR